MRLDLLQCDPEVTAVGHDFEDAREQVVGVAERLEGLAIEPAGDGRHGLVGAGEGLGGLRRPILPQTIDRLEPQAQVLGRLAEEPRSQALAKQVAPGLLGVQQLPVG